MADHPHTIDRWDDATGESICGVGDGSGCGDVQTFVFPLCESLPCAVQPTARRPVDWAGLLVNLRGMSNRDGMAQSAGKLTLPLRRCPAVTLNAMSEIALSPRLSSPRDPTVSSDR